MATYITQTKGLAGSPTLHKQEYLVTAARRQGILPLSLYYYPVDADSSGELSARQDGILSGVSFGDDIIVQLPTMLGRKYEQTLLDKIGSFRGKLIIALSSLPASMETAELAADIQLYNRADVLIVPSVEAGTFLREHGLQVARLVYLNVWDQSCALSLARPTFKRQIATTDASLAKQLAGQWVRPSVTTAYDLHAAGGFALLWLAPKYDSEVVTGQVLASGLPILVNRSSYLARIVERAGIGETFADLAAVSAYVDQCTKTDYHALAANAGWFSAFLREGGFTSHAISQAVAFANQLK